MNPEHNRLNIAGVLVDPVPDLSWVLKASARAIEEGKGLFIVPMNPIKVMKCNKKPEFRDVVRKADLVIPDAWGIKWAAKTLYQRHINLVPGYTVGMGLLKAAAQRDWRVFILGTTEDILREATEKLRQQMPGLKLVGTHHGFFTRHQEEQVFKQVAEAKPDIVLVAMGEYKQEMVIDRLRPMVPGAVMIGVGGTVDLIAGHQPKPPDWMVKRHLEWLYRLLRQPKRAPRFVALPWFVVAVLKQRLLG